MFRSYVLQNMAFFLGLRRRCLHNGATVDTRSSLYTQQGGQGERSVAPATLPELGDAETRYKFGRVYRTLGTVQVHASKRLSCHAGS